MKNPVSIKEQACLISMTGSTVTIECDERIDAEELFEFLFNLGNEDA